jgi:hypothetical protein
VTGALDTIYQTVLEKLAEAAQALQDLLDWLRDAVGRVIAELPAIGAWLNEQWNRLLTEAGRALDWISKLLRDVGGDPGAIRQVGEDWVNQVGAVTSAQAAALQRGQLPSFGQWSGNAADVYYVGAGLNQTSALSNFKDATDSVNEAVNEMANAVGSFWSNVGVAVAVFVGAMVAVKAAEITVIGIPPGVVATIVACIAFSAAINNAFVGLGNSFDMVDRLFAAATNVPAIQAGWPKLQSTDTLSDASVTDGDPSEWRPTA